MDITIDNYYYSCIIPHGMNINNYDIFYINGINSNGTHITVATLLYICIGF